MVFVMATPTKLDSRLGTYVLKPFKDERFRVYVPPPSPLVFGRGFSEPQGESSVAFRFDRDGFDQLGLLRHQRL
jgi:hypothetical protein